MQYQDVKAGKSESGLDGTKEVKMEKMGVLGAEEAVPKLILSKAQMQRRVSTLCAGLMMAIKEHEPKRPTKK